MPERAEDTRGALGVLLGSEGLVLGEDASRTYFSGPVGGFFTSLAPRTTEEVRRVIRYAADEGIPVYTLKDGHLPEWVKDDTGFILDTSMMKTIEKIDAQSLAAHVQPGVTYRELGVELERYGLKTLTPAAATSDYVAGNAVNRTVTQAACRYPETQFSNLALVLADGSLHKTGQHALSEEYGDWKDIGGPHLDKWFHCSEEIFGITVRATVWLYPMLDGREANLFAFETMESMLGFLEDVSRRELCQEAVGFDAPAASRILARSREGGTWFALVGTESFPEHSDYQWRKIREIAGHRGGKDAGDDSADLLEHLGRPWNVDPQTHLGFYSLFSRAGELDREVMEGSTPGGGEEPDRYFVSVGMGRCLYAGYRLPSGPSIELAEKGAFFDRPLGDFAAAYYPRTTGYLEMMRRVKRMMDPGGILNPDQPYRGWLE